MSSLNAGGDAEVSSGQTIGGDISAGGDANLSAAGNITAIVSATNDVTFNSGGTVSSQTSAGHDLTVIAYGGIILPTETAMSAGNDIEKLWTAGDIDGTFIAQSGIGTLDPTWIYPAVTAYHSIDATLSTGTGTNTTDPFFGVIQSVGAWGPISGAFSATISIGPVNSEEAMTATLTAPTVTTPQSNAHNVLPPEPDAPNYGLESVQAQINGALEQVAQAKAGIAAGKTAAQQASAAGAAQPQQGLQQLQAATNQSKQEYTAQIAASINAGTEGWQAGQAYNQNLLNQAKAGAAAALLSVKNAAAAAKAQLTLAVTQATTAVSNAQTIQTYQFGVLNSQATAESAANQAQVTAEKNQLATQASQHETQWETAASALYQQTVDEVKNWAIQEAHKVLNAISIGSTLLSTVIPPLFFVGRVADALNGALYLEQGDYLNAGLCALSALPLAGAAVEGLGSLSSGMSTVEEGAVADAELADNVLADGENADTAVETQCTGENCFVAGTQIVAAMHLETNEAGPQWQGGGLAVAAKVRYVTQPIETLQVGDLVLAGDEHDPDSPLELRRVEAVFVRTTYQLTTVMIRSSTGRDQTLYTTNEHPLYVPGIGWVAVQDLKEGDELKEPAGGVSTVISTEYRRHPKGVTVYNFRVGASHTYFVREEGSTAEPVWVHNALCGEDFEGEGAITSLFRKMSAEEAEATLATRELQAPIAGSNSSKYLSESLAKVQEFENAAVDAGTEEVIVEFQVDRQAYNELLQNATNQYGSAGVNALKVNFEGNAINVGMPKGLLAEFNNIIQQVRIV